MKIAGYLTNDSSGNLSGVPGSTYNYIMAGNGVFLHADNEHLEAMVQIARVKIRGLGPLTPFVVLQHGKIPATIFADSLRQMGLNISRELYLAVVWENGAYSLRVPDQEASGAHVTYLQLPNKVLDLHSHPTFSGRFSGVDNQDEIGFQLYGVIGHVDKLIPEYTFRVGVYGHFYEMRLEDIFDANRR